MLSLSDRRYQPAHTGALWGARRSGVFLALALLLTACATAPEPKIITKTVLVPTAVSCVPKTFRDPPVTPDSDAAVRAAAGPGELLQLLAAGRLLYRQWIAEAKPILAGCR